MCRSILHLLSSFSVTTEIGCPTLLVLARTALPGALVVFLLLLVTLDRDDMGCYAKELEYGIVNNIKKANKSNTTYLFLEMALFLLSPLAIEPGVAPECVTILLVIQND